MRWPCRSNDTGCVKAKGVDVALVQLEKGEETNDVHAPKAKDDVHGVCGGAG